MRKPHKVTVHAYDALTPVTLDLTEAEADVVRFIAELTAQAAPKEHDPFLTIEEAK